MTEAKDKTKPEEKIFCPVTGCWYYDHNVCGLPHPGPTQEEYEASIRKDERDKVLNQTINGLTLIVAMCEAKYRYSEIRDASMNAIGILQTIGEI